MKIEAFIAFLRKNGKQDVAPNDRGNTIHRLHLPDDRYCIDFAEDFRECGFEQFDTDQDAHYFGVWLSRKKRIALSYCEGDWTLVSCQDDAHYFAEVQSYIDFHKAGSVARVIGSDGSMVVVEQDRSKFLSDTPEPQIGIGDVLAAVLS